MTAITRRVVLRNAVLAAVGASIPWPRAAADPATSPATAPVTAPSHITSIANRVHLLIRQLRGGLDYYGNPSNYVSSLSVDTFEQANSSIIQGGIALDTAFTKYQGQRSDQSKRLEAFNQSVTQAKKQVRDNQAAQDRAAQNAKVINDQINDLLMQQVSSLDRVNRTAATLQRTLESGGGGCSFSEIIGVASLIITFATGIPAEFTAISSAASDALAPFAGAVTVAGMATKIKDIEKISGTFQQIKDQYGKIKAALPGHSPDPHVDDTKLLMSDSDFATTRDKIESNLKALPDSPEKHEYQDAIDSYLAIVQLRNQKLIAYDGLLFQISQLEASNKTLTTSISSLEDQELAIQSQDVSGTFETVAKIREGLIKQTYYQLLQHARALDYWTLMPQDPPFTIRDFNALNGTLGQLVERRVTALEVLANPPAHFDALPVPVVVNLTDDDRERLASTGKLRFEITTEHPAFANFAHVLIEKLTISFFTSNTPDPQGFLKPIGYDLEHSGVHVFNNISRTRLTFVTTPRTVLYEMDENGTPTTVGSFADSDARIMPGSSTYIGVSPFSSWKVVVHNVDAPLRAKLRQVKCLELHFVGTARAYTA